MNTRLMRYSLVAGLALVLAVPAIAYSQYGPQGPRFAPAGGRTAVGVQGAMQQRGPQRFADRNLAPQRRFAAGPGGAGAQFGGRNVRSGLTGRGMSRGRGSGLAGRGMSRGPGSGLAGRALARAEQIELTDEQGEQISAAQRGHREASINRRAATQIAELELRQLAGADNPDIAAVEAKMREVSEQRIAAMTGSLRLNAAVSEILTAEQIQQLDELGRRPDNRGPRGTQNRRREPVEPR